jgi:hypothetical protein
MMHVSVLNDACRQDSVLGRVILKCVDPQTHGELYPEPVRRNESVPLNPTYRTAQEVHSAVSRFIRHGMKNNAHI